MCRAVDALAFLETETLQYDDGAGSRSASHEDSYEVGSFSSFDRKIPLIFIFKFGFASLHIIIAPIDI